MTWEVNIIEFLQKNSGGAFDYIMFMLTHLGDKLFFIMIAAVIYWCVSKKFGFRFITVYLFSAGCNDVVKSLFKRVRPYAAQGGIRSIFTKTHGWSFPSGHSNSIAVIGTQLSQKAHRQKIYFRPVLIISIAVTIIVMFTRVYLGQHYPTDVIIGAGLGIVLALIFGIIFEKIENKSSRFWLVVLPISLIVTAILLVTDSAQSSSTLIQALGAYAAVTVGYMLEEKYVGYNVRSGGVTAQILKVLIGLGVAVLLFAGGEYLSSILIPSGAILEAVLIWYVLYFIIGLWITLGANYVFKKLKI